ncbi:MAG TPA: hypothetical protein VHA78_02690 [Candidatus Peribacteraceae bacterium]|nr:hypothetical protein [Candidatus Peribacteraceae bacterium]
MKKSIEDIAATLTDGLSRFGKSTPDAPDYHYITQTIRTTYRQLLQELLDTDVDWDTNLASPYAHYLPLMNQADEAVKKAAAIASEQIPRAERKVTPKRIVHKIDTHRTFASANEFRRAAEKVNDIATKYFSQEGIPNLRTHMMCEKIAEFCSVYLSLTRDKVAALPGTSTETKRSLDWYDRYRPVAENIRDAESSEEWMQLIFRTPGNPNLHKKWDEEDEDSED